MALPVNRIPVIDKGWIRVVVFCMIYIAVLLMAAPALISVPLTISILVNVAISIALVAFFRLFVDRLSIASLGLYWNKNGAISGLFTAIGIIGGGSLLLFISGYLKWTNAHLNAGDLIAAFFLMLAVAVGEELVFRGYILNNLMESVKPLPALAISSLLFASMHAGNAGLTPLAFFNLFLGGLIPGINYIYTRNLWFAVIFHLCWNYLQGPVLGYEVSGVPFNSLLQLQLSGTDLFTGGIFGFEGSIADTIVSLLALAILAMIFKRKYGRFA